LKLLLLPFGCFLWGVLPFILAFLDSRGFVAVVVLPTIACVGGAFALVHGATLWERR